VFTSMKSMSRYKYGWWGENGQSAGTRCPAFTHPFTLNQSTALSTVIPMGLCGVPSSVAAFEEQG
jgi:hypothetical protein